MPILEQQLTIDAPPGAVWRVLREFGDVAKWAPYLRESRETGGPPIGRGSSRELRHQWGFRLSETVTEWHEGKSFVFNVFGVPFPLVEVCEAWAVSPSPSGTLVIQRVSYRVRLGPFGAIMDRALISSLIRREMRAGLLGLKRFVEADARFSDDRELRMKARRTAS